MARLLLDSGAIINKEYELVFAAQTGNLVAVRKLIADGVSPNAEDQGWDGGFSGNALGWAAAMGQKDVVLELLSHGAQEIERALLFAKRQKHFEIASVLEVALTGVQKGES